MSDVLNESLDYRQSRIKAAKDYLARTRQLFDAFGSTELKASHARFEELAKGLESTNVRLVVIGEFSRGKSSLVNALLNIELLRSAQEATTAINTFIQALPADRSERFIRIHYQDGKKAALELDWKEGDYNVLEAWGTELDSNNAVARKEVDRIEIFTPHVLLDKNLVLIDTPGLQSLSAHHAEITHRAIAGAHIAIWVQSTQQLGGNATEWEFLQGTIRKNFNKFLTVVNMWDAVLEPTDPQDKIKPESQRVQEKMDRVKHNFREKLAGQAAAELDLLINDDHLMGVSAQWAMSGDADKKSRSGLDKLSKRISEMLTSGEAMEEIFRKPLQHLSYIQEQLILAIEDELAQLESSATQEERSRDIELFDQEIKNLELQMRTVAQESQSEHDRAAKALSEMMERELIEPLSELKADIESQVDARYVEKMVAKQVRQIGLPEDLHQEFLKVSTQVGKCWTAQKKKLLKVLEDLRSEYAENMQRHAGQLKSGLGQLDVTIPSLDVGFNLDVSEIEQYHAKAQELEQGISARRNEIDSLEEEKLANASNAQQVLIAQQAVSRAERQIEMMGSQPAPHTTTRREKVSDGGMYGSDKYASVSCSDDSNVRSWKEDRAQQQKLLGDKEVRLAEIIAAEELKTNRRMTQEAAQKKYEREVADMLRKQKTLEESMLKEKRDLVESTLRKLVANTAGQLDQRIQYLQNHAKDAVHTLFAQQMNLLEGCVQEQFLEPLNAKRAQREAVLELLQKSAAEIAQRKASLGQAHNDIAALHAQTLAAVAN